MPQLQQLGLDFGYEPEIPYILISLKEPWHLKILSGEKHYEYRRQFIKSPTHAFIYVTGAVRSVCAYAEFDHPIVGTVDRIAAIYESEKPQSTKGIYNYFGNRDQCFAIPIKKYYEIRKATLDELRQKFDGFAAPQSYIYLDKKPELLNHLLSLKQQRAESG